MALTTSRCRKALCRSCSIQSCSATRSNAPLRRAPADILFCGSVLGFGEGGAARRGLVCGKLAIDGLGILAIARHRGLLATSAGAVQGHALGAAVEGHGAAALAAGHGDMGVENHHIVAIERH